MNEAYFVQRVREYIIKNGYKDIYSLTPPKSRRYILPQSIELPELKKTKELIQDYEEFMEKTIKKHHKLYSRFKDYPHIKELIVRYDVWGFLNNISLSVHPSIKKNWGINFELFGAFYNTNTPYCTLFPDLEKDGVENAFFFKPRSGQVILANSPYTTQHIRWTIRKILDEWLGKASFWVVIPVWDKKTRKELRLKEYPDFPEINELAEKSIKAEVVHKFLFWDGIENKNIHLKDPIWVIHI